MFRSHPWLWVLVIALAVAVLLAPLACAWPDGLQRVAGALGFAERAHAASLPALAAHYALPGLAGRSATALAGLLGTLLVFAALSLLAHALTGGRRTDAGSGS